MMRGAVTACVMVLLVACTLPAPPLPVPPLPVPPQPVVAAKAADSMTFPFPFRGVAYRMTIVDGQGEVAGLMTLAADQGVSEDLARTAASNACAFTGRFPVAAMVGVEREDGKSWLFDASCL